MSEVQNLTAKLRRDYNYNINIPIQERFQRRVSYVLLSQVLSLSTIHL
uniref:Uncharacterized protein n=1 Tax=Arundo donax TaxID=35708 RepID=A0A0A9GUN7_ARUDO